MPVLSQNPSLRTAQSLPYQESLLGVRSEMSSLRSSSPASVRLKQTVPRTVIVDTQVPRKSGHWDYIICTCTSSCHWNETPKENICQTHTMRAQESNCRHPSVAQERDNDWNPQTERLYDTNNENYNRKTHTELFPRILWQLTWLHLMKNLCMTLTN